jgi:hypothetical protein
VVDVPLALGVHGRGDRRHQRPEGGGPGHRAPAASSEIQAKVPLKSHVRIHDGSRSATQAGRRSPCIFSSLGRSGS